MITVDEAELSQLFGLADMNLGAYVESLDTLLMEHPKASRGLWFSRLLEITKGLDADDLRVIVAVAVVRLRDAEKSDG